MLASLLVLLLTHLPSPPSEAPMCLCEEVLVVKQFEAYLRLIYNRPDMLARFPHGF